MPTTTYIVHLGGPDDTPGPVAPGFERIFEAAGRDWFPHGPGDERNSLARMRAIDAMGQPQPRPVPPCSRCWTCDWCFEPCTRPVEWAGGHGHPACAMYAYRSVMGPDAPPWAPGAHWR